MLSSSAVLCLIAAGSLTYTLAGLTLGTALEDVTSSHPDARQYPRSRGTLWEWKRAEGGTVSVYTDRSGVIFSITFTAEQSEAGTIDLPCAGKFDIQDSHVNLDFAIDKKICVPGNMGTYELPDHSILDVTFDGPGDGQLQEAAWYRPVAPQPHA
jgi:hypothetical protein